MSRKNGNIKMQLNKRIDGLLRIGEKKIKDDRTNPNRAEGIHSVKTAEIYRQTANYFGEYLKQQNIRSIDAISREDIAGFMATRSNLSPYTYSRELSAINKMLDTRYTLKDFGLSRRSYSDITNNRGFSKWDTSNKERNREALEFVRACGMRRSSIAQVKPSDFIRDDKGVIFGVHLVEKGGRERFSVVLEEYREKITQAVNLAQEKGGDSPFLREPDRNANPHWQRAEYAQNLYNDLLNARELGQDYYSNRRDLFINDSALIRATSRYSTDTVKGYVRDIIGEVSQALGHNRLDVVLYHYLKA